MNEVSTSALRQSGSAIVITVPLQVKRRNGRKEIIAPIGADGATSYTFNRNEKLALTLARVLCWQQLWEEGRFSSLRELAASLGQHPSYIFKQMKLTLLAPDIIETILLGQEPSGLSLEKLYDMPVTWDEQRQVLGFRSG